MEDMNELEKDAARYRYLRDTQNNGCRDMSDGIHVMGRVGVIDHIFVAMGENYSESPSSNMIDEYIDNAMLLYSKEAE